MKIEEAKNRIVAAQAKIDMKKLDSWLDNDNTRAADSCNKIRVECRNLRKALKNAGCVGGEADPFICQPLWDDLNAAYEALHDCQHAKPKKVMNK